MTTSHSPALLSAFLRYFLPLATSILVASYFYADSHRDSERSHLESSEMLNVRLGAGMLDRRLLITLRDLRIVGASSALKRFTDTADSRELDRIADDFLGFSEARRAYMQVRLLDIRGQELVRVDHDGQQARIIERSQLQNKGDRYYFRDSIKLPPGAIYLSPLDLNIERGEIEKPYNPTLRIATPLADRDGKTCALLILNYRAGEMLGYVADVTTQAADRLMIVNEDGYFLHAPNAEDAWGFMFGKRELSLPHRFPESWETIRQTGQGQFTDRHGLWSVASAYSARGAQDRLLPAQLNNVHEHHWKVISFVPTRELPRLFSDWTASTTVLELLLLCLAAALSAFLATTERRRELQKARFAVYFERSMVGIAINDPNKAWLAVNPALCRMLGYTGEDLQQRSWTELIHPDDLANSRALFDRVKQGEVDDFEVVQRYLRADGKAITARVVTHALRNTDGSLDSVINIIEDISDRLAAEKALRDNEDRLRRLGDNLPDSYLFQCRMGDDENLKFTYLSTGVQTIHGLTPEEALTNPDRLFSQVAPSQLPKLLEATAESKRQQSDFAIEIRFIHPDGEWHWLIIRSRPRRSATGETIWDGVATDITSRRQNEIQLDLQSRRAQALLELPWQGGHLDEPAFLEHTVACIASVTDSPQGLLCRISGDGNVLEQIAAWPSPASGTPLWSARLDETGKWADAVRLRQPILIENHPVGGLDGRHPSETPISRLASVPVYGEQGMQLLVCVMNKDEPYTLQDIESIQLVANSAWRIVSQKRAQQALQVALQVVNASPVVCFRWQATDGWPVVFVSDNVANWGYSVDDLIAGKPAFADMVHPDDLQRISEEVVRYTDEGRNDYTQEYRLLTGDGRVIWVLDKTRVIRDAKGVPSYFDGVITDISERRQQTEELNATLSAQRQLNKRLEEAHNQLLQSEKMASIGQLAAGIAHELNNPIGFVHSNLGTLESYLRDLLEIIDAYDKALSESAGSEPQRESIARLCAERDFAYVRSDIVQLLSESKEGLSRVRKIVQDLKNFSHVSEQEWQWADLHQGLDSTLNIVWNELKYKCQVVKEYGELPKVYCLISQLNQVFMNLLVNAGHAIETKGTITIRTARHGEKEVRIEICDTGKGIAPEHLTRIFEPFFTTKPIGKGTGLGLSLSYGIVDRHHGRIEVDSQPGAGSTFRVILPIQQAASQPETSQ